MVIVGAIYIVKNNTPYAKTHDDDDDDDDDRCRENPMVTFGTIII